VGYAALAQACLWEYCGTAKLTWSASSQAIWAWATGGPEPLLVSLFNVKWRFCAPAGGVEGSKLCLFSVIMPAKCVSSVSPRFHYRRLVKNFCFLPLAAILESPIMYYLEEHWCWFFEDVVELNNESIIFSRTNFSSLILCIILSMLMSSIF
jgi:hypothetical protein